MLRLALLLLAAALLLLPGWWVFRVLRRYGVQRADIRGTGGELALHLCTRFKLEKITVQLGTADYYDPNQRCIVLQPMHFSGKSLTAIAVAAHEFSHALQHAQRDWRLLSRTACARLARAMHLLAMGLIMLAPLFSWWAPGAMVALLIAGVAANAVQLLLHLITVPVEWDASFQKALPILVSGEYITKEDVPAVRRILRACAMTYVANAMMQLIYFWYRAKIRR